MNDYRRSFDLREVADKKGYLVRYLYGFRSLLVPPKTRTNCGIHQNEIKGLYMTWRTYNILNFRRLFL